MLVYLAISLVVRCVVGRLGYVGLMGLKLGGRCKYILFYRLSRNGISIIPIPLIINLTLQLKIFSRRCSSICWPMLLVGLICWFVFAIEIFQIRFHWHRLLLYYLALQQNVLSMMFLLSISSIPSSALSDHFIFVFVLNSCFFRSVLPGTLEYIESIRGTILNFYLIPVVLNI